MYVIDEIKLQTLWWLGLKVSFIKFTDFIYIKGELNEFYVWVWPTVNSKVLGHKVRF